MSNSEENEEQSAVSSSISSKNNSSSGSSWPEVRKAAEGRRFELNLVGPDISKRIADNGGLLDNYIWKLNQLNLLEIAKTKLNALPKELGLLNNITTLMCHHNELASVPAELGRLLNLKHLDLSFNKLQQIPPELGNLRELMTINLSSNQLSELFPNLAEMTKLAVLDISNNKFTRLPGDLGSSTLENLSQINASYNELVELSDNLCELPSLKTLNLFSNRLTQVPANLCECHKLKELLLKENKLKDNRLKKLVEQDKGKAVIDYLERIYAEECKNKPKQAKPAAQQTKKGNKSNAAADFVQEYDLVSVLHYSHEQTPSRDISMTDTASNVRPYICCCIVRDIDLDEGGALLKKFFTIQTNIQDETCQKRILGTIATHDLDKIKANMVYDAIDPEEIEVYEANYKSIIFTSSIN
jgi:hypothetical protein